MQADRSFGVRRARFVHASFFTYTSRALSPLKRSNSEHCFRCTYLGHPRQNRRFPVAHETFAPMQQCYRRVINQQNERHYGPKAWSNIADIRCVLNCLYAWSHDSSRANGPHRSSVLERAVTCFVRKTRATLVAEIDGMRKTIKPLLSLFLLSSLLALLQEGFAANPDNENTPSPSEASAGDDILVVIDLPLAADLARESGLAEAEIAATIQVAQEAGVSAGEASEVLVQEADATEKRGVRAGLSHWLSLKWSSGVHGQRLAEEIVDRPQTEAPSTEEQQKLQQQLKAQKKLALEQRKAQREQDRKSVV